jgi:PAS domain S-box-containing protein
MQSKMERHLILWGFVAAAAILVLSGWASYRNTARFAEAAEWRKHTYEVLRTIDETVARLVDAETGQRGYLLTGNEAYLEPYRKAIKNLDQVTRHLKDLTYDNPNQQKRIQTMEPLIEKKLAELQRTIDFRRNEGLAAANQVVQEGTGKQWMDQIRALASEMANEESDLLRLRTQKANESVTRSARTIAAGTLVSISLLVVCFGLLSRELAERKRTQKALEKSEKWLSTTLGSIGDAVIATDMNGAVTFMNSVAQSLTGWSWEEARGKSMDLVFDIVNKETRRPVENPVKKVFREGKVVGLADHTLLISKGGREFDIEDSAAPIVTGAGEDFGVVLVFRDITALKQAREELDRYFTLSIDLLCIAGSDGYFKRLNPAWQKTLGFTLEELLAKPYLDFIHSDDRERTIQEAEKQGKGLEVVSFENRYLCKDGSYKWLSWSATPIIDEKLIYAVARDITELKQTQEALVRAKEEAERASKFKDQFLSTMSHELRTPLNAVLGFSDLLADERYGSLNDRQRRYVGNIHSGGQHLLKLISDILDLSKIEAGRMDLAIQDVPIEAAFDEVANALRPLAEKKSQTLSQNAQPGTAVRADATRLKQMLMNLAGNAIKFTPEGGRIEMVARQVDRQVRVEVRDTGLGIPPEEQKRIFEAFYRLRRSGEATEGTGLGLAITQRLAELHGSELKLETEPGRGSCFYFSLPVAVAREPRARESSVTIAARGTQTILVIEDDRVTAHLIQSQLTSSGYEAIVCDQPQNAARMAVELQPDAITLDLLMKPSNGWEVLLELKRNPATANIPVIVISIVDQPAVGATLGADDYLVKPVDREVLLRAVQRCLMTRGGALPQRPILVVEDHTPIREMIAELLTDKGYKVIVATDGAEARARVAESVPELVILDLLLPKVSGFELLGEWRAKPRTADLPVFVLTSKDLNKQEEQYLRSHAESLFRKQQPWQNDLIEQLQRVLKSAPAVQS